MLLVVSEKDIEEIIKMMNNNFEVKEQSNGTYKVIDVKNNLSRVVHTRSYALHLIRNNKLA